MAVIAKWMCDRDNRMFDSKKEADAHDKMLELAEQISALLQAKVSDVSDKDAEEFGIFLARNKDTLAKAIKGQPEVLASLLEENGETDQTVRAVA